MPAWTPSVCPLVVAALLAAGCSARAEHADRAAVAAGRDPAMAIPVEPARAAFAVPPGPGPTVLLDGAVRASRAVVAGRDPPAACHLPHCDPALWRCGPACASAGLACPPDERCCGTTCCPGRCPDPGAGPSPDPGARAGTAPPEDRRPQR